MLNFVVRASAHLRLRDVVFPKKKGFTEWSRNEKNVFTARVYNRSCEIEEKFQISSAFNPILKFDVKLLFRFIHELEKWNEFRSEGRECDCASKVPLLGITFYHFFSF